MVCVQIQGHQEYFKELESKSTQTYRKVSQGVKPDNCVLS